MDIVIAGALPHTSIAREMQQFLEKSAPHMLERLRTHHAQQQIYDLDQLGYTPLDAYQLEVAGLPLAASSLSALHLPSALQQHLVPDRAIYLMQLAHIALGQHSASLHTADELAITPAQSLALFENAQTIFAHSPYKLLAYHPDYFLVDLGPEFTAALASPNLLATGYMSDWWPQDQATRPLRALLGELQMSWFNHPVNQEREAQGKRAINSAWIFGGIKSNTAYIKDRAEQIKRATDFAKDDIKYMKDSAEKTPPLPNINTTNISNTDASNTDITNTDITNTDASNTDASNTDASTINASNYLLIDDLIYSHRQQDWGVWLQQLSNLDQRLPEIIAHASNPSRANASVDGNAKNRALMQANAKPRHRMATLPSKATESTPYRLVLCGLDRQVILTPQSWLKRTLHSKKQWKSWW